MREPLLPLAVLVPAGGDRLHGYLTWRIYPRVDGQAPRRDQTTARQADDARHSGCCLRSRRQHTWGWGSPKTLGLLALGSLLIVAWVREELRSREPLVDMRMMAIRAVWTTNAAAFLIGVGMYSSFILLPELVQEPKSNRHGFAPAVTTAGLFPAAHHDRHRDRRQIGGEPRASHRLARVG